MMPDEAGSEELDTLPLPYSREALEALKRRELQLLCKKHEIKNIDLIDKLLEVVSISDENQGSLHGIGVEDSEHEIDPSNPEEGRVENVEAKELAQAITDHKVKLDGVPLAEKEANTGAMAMPKLVAKPSKTIQSTIPMAPIRPTRPVKTAATAKKTFDLQESLKKSLSYKPHKGPLKPFTL